jgi:hypothetical protein
MTTQHAATAWGSLIYNTQPTHASRPHCAPVLTSPERSRLPHLRPFHKDPTHHTRMQERHPP